VAGASNHVDRGRPGGARFAWLSLFFAAWITGGLALANWALNRGLANDVGFSLYHIPAYLGLLALAVFCISIVIRAIRHGRSWRQAFPPGYGLLGAGLLVALAYPIVDVGWREGIGIMPGIEGSLAPSRVLIPIGIILVAIGPLRVALGSPDAVVNRWAAVLSAGFTLALLGFPGGFQPAFGAWLERPPHVPQGNTEVWAMDADGARQTRLVEADDVSSASAPTWSPDQTHLAYQRWQLGADGGLDADIWVGAADGSGRRMLVGGADWQWFPHWSPDGAWIVYTQEPEGGPGMAAGPVGPATVQGPQGPGFGPTSPVRSHAAIWRVRPDGTGSATQLTTGQADDRAAAYSPDGTRLVFDSLRDGNTEIYVMNADGSNPHRLTDDPGEDWGAAWSPDGTQIAFNSNRTGNMQVYVVNGDGTGLTRLTHDNADDREAIWSPDGSRIAFESINGSEHQIWSMAADGSDLRDLSRSPGASAGLGGSSGAWGRDGRIVYARWEDPPVISQPLVREDLAAAGMLLEAILVAIVALMIIRIVPPFGAFAVIMGMAVLLPAASSDQWRFVPAAVAAGLMVDLLVHLAPPRRKAKVAGAASAAAFVLGAGVSVALTTGLGWTPSLLLGVAFATAVLGWSLAAVVGRLADGPEGRTVA
jgi:Tol biopolymer transport system component